MANHGNAQEAGGSRVVRMNRAALERQEREKHRKQIRDVTALAVTRAVGYLPESVWEDPVLLAHIQEYPRLLDYLVMERMNRRMAGEQAWGTASLYTRYIRPYVMRPPVFPGGLMSLPEATGIVLYSPGFSAAVEESDAAGQSKQRRGSAAKEQTLLRLEELAAPAHGRQRTYDYFAEQTVPGTACATGDRRESLGLPQFVHWALNYFPRDFQQRCFARAAVNHGWAYVEWKDGKLAFRDGHEDYFKGERISTGDYLLLNEGTYW